MGQRPTFAFGTLLERQANKANSEYGMTFRTATLQALLEPSVTALGYDFVAIELTGDGSQTIIRVYIDLPGGITVSDCEKVSRQRSEEHTSELQSH